MYYTNLIYFSVLHVIGGIETWLYNLSVLYKDLDVTVVIRQGDIKQIERLSRNFRVIKWDGKKRFTCKNLFVCFNQDIIPYVDAETVYCVLHGDYEEMVNCGQLARSSLPVNRKVDKYIAITERVAKGWESLTGFKAEVSYNPVIAREKKIIRICSAQRMSAEKGVKRIKELEKALDRYSEENDTKWLWDIYCDNYKLAGSKIVFRGNRLDITELYKAYDWFVILSDNEGYCYSAVENLTLGVPCVVTDLPVFRELGFDDSNSIKMRLDMGNIDEVAMKMFTEKKKFTYIPPEDNWRFYFGNAESNYKYAEVEEMKHKVVALDTYEKHRIKDAELDMIPPKGYQFTVSDDRLQTLLGNNKRGLVFVSLADEQAIEEEAPAEKKKRSRKKK